MEILIISGFLGAGKTTFIKEMAKATKRQYVIIENEFSEFSIDGPLLSDDKIDGAALEVRELSEGCICCSGKLDFASTVLTVANTLDPDYLLVEPSGVAFPGRILNNLNKICYERIKILDPITILDGVNYLSSKTLFKDFFEDQILTAKHIVISKSESFSEDDFKHIKENLDLDDSVNFPMKHYKYWTEEEWWNLLKKSDSNKNKSYEEREMEIEAENIGFNPFVCSSPDEIVYILEELQTGKYGNIIRAKGFFNNGDLDYRFDYVSGQYQISGNSKMEDSRAVVIGTDLKHKKLKKLFNAIKNS